MLTKLIEFNNKNKQLLRGVLSNAHETKSQQIVVMLGGFERAGTTEKKFKALANKLSNMQIDSFRFDATDCGLSDGNFYNMTTESLADDLISAAEYLKDLGYQRFSVVGHSLAGCAISLLLNKVKLEKIVLIAPALNQKDLLRLWFAQKNNKEVKIDWDNYKNYYKEKEFLENLKFDLTTKIHKLNYKYRSDNQNIDYSFNYKDYSNDLILLIHGTNDDKVPLESLNIDFNNKIIIKKGDHDLEQPGIIEQWLDQVVDFLK